MKNGKLPKNLLVAIKNGVKSCIIFIGENFHDKSSFKKKSRIIFHKSNQFCYFGNNISISDTVINIQGNNDFVVIGNGITVTSLRNSWVTGFNAGKESNGLIIGDHCLIAAESMIRCTDGHPIIDLITDEQINISQQPIIIEPYCWIGQRATILKNTRIGACSIVGFGAVVTKSCEKFSVLSGVPATSRSIYGKLWKRNHNDDAQTIFNKYKKRFILDKED
jgi:acetyltransferase-like isoleucine patch superfamily enzyme